MGTAGRGRERASDARPGWSKVGVVAAPDVPVFAVGTRPANAAGKQAFRANRKRMAVCKFHRRYGGTAPTRGDGGIEPGAAYLLPITADALSVEPSSARRFCSPGRSKPGIFARMQVGMLSVGKLTNKCRAVG